MNPVGRVMVLALILASRASPHLTAQCSTCAEALLNLPGGARPIGVAGAYAAGDGPDALFYNPASVNSAHGATLGAERVGGATAGYFGTTGSAGSLGVGASVRFLDRPGSPITQSGELFGGELVAGVAAGAHLHGFALGVGANFITPDLAASGSTVGFDLGLARQISVVAVALTIQNLGGDVAGAPLPSRVTVSAAVPRTSISAWFDVAAWAAVSRERDGTVIPKAGVELIYEPVSGWTVAARVGLRRTANDPLLLEQSAMSLGGSLGLDRWSLDYAFQPAVGNGHPVHSLGLRVQ